MKDKILYGILGTIIILLIFVIVRIETIHSANKNIQNDIQSITAEQNIIKTLISKDQNIPQISKYYKIDIGNSVVLGNKKAPITIVKWTDFQCPWCAKSSPLVTELLEKYPKHVKVVIKNFPLSSHKQAFAAAKYSIAAHKQGKYKEMYNKIFANYKALTGNENLPVTYAKELGLNMDQFLVDYNSSDITTQINNEMKQLRTSGMRLSVPKFLINGREPQGPRTIDNWSSIIERELKKIKS